MVACYYNKNVLLCSSFWVRLRMTLVYHIIDWWDLLKCKVGDLNESTVKWGKWGSEWQTVILRVTESIDMIG